MKKTLIDRLVEVIGNKEMTVPQIREIITDKTSAHITNELRRSNKFKWVRRATWAVSNEVEATPNKNTVEAASKKNERKFVRVAKPVAKNVSPIMNVLSAQEKEIQGQIRNLQAELVKIEKTKKIYS